ncbi:unnamed protein product [Moneuplotes crassus]|uniref:Uncharacterized protein n=1 Tax=Euplotes crassus TaxID=5936 RepID=A0AAD1UJN9_EUPCR|nr:unnamed protein product [Moneuplotes crassus]
MKASLHPFFEEEVQEESRIVEEELAKHHFANSFGDISNNPEGNRISNMDNYKIQLSLFMTHHIFTNYCKQKQFLKLFNLKSINFNCIKRKNKHVLNMLSFSFPQEVMRLRLHSDLNLVPRLTPYFNEIMRNSSRVVRSLCISEFRINARQFKRIVVGYSHVTKIELSSCKISVPAVVHLGGILRDCKIETINLKYSEREEYSNWINDTGELERLVQSLATSDGMKLSLRKLEVSLSLISKSNVSEILNENGFSHVKLSGLTFL